MPGPLLGVSWLPENRWGNIPCDSRQMERSATSSHFIWNRCSKSSQIYSESVTFLGLKEWEKRNASVWALYSFDRKTLFSWNIAARFCPYFRQDLNLAIKRIVGKLILVSSPKWYWTSTFTLGVSTIALAMCAIKSFSKTHLGDGNLRLGEGGTCQNGLCVKG